MSSALEINGQKLYTIKDAAQVISYSRDYITRLAREEKIVATLIGRQWYVDLESLKDYVDSVSVEQEIRKKHLSAERKRERVVHEVVEKKEVEHSTRVKGLHIRAAVAACVVLGLGVFSGWVIDELGVISQVTPTLSFVEPAAPQQTAQVSGANAVASIELPAGTLLPPGAYATDTVVFTQTTFVSTSTGILLLPNISDKERVLQIRELFSDPVVIRENEDGQRVVVRVDEYGNEMGEEIPFVSVPVQDSIE